MAAQGNGWGLGGADAGGATGQRVFFRSGAAGARWEEGGVVVFCLVDLLGRRDREISFFFPYILPRELATSTRGRGIFPESPFSCTRGRTSSPSANSGTRGTNFFFVFLPPFL
jgi:hypothetical protein